jgi:hypothetical protein
MPRPSQRSYPRLWRHPRRGQCVLLAQVHSVRKAIGTEQHEDHMRVWAEQTVDVTAELVELLSNEYGEDEFNARSGQLFVALRCQIDKGRWFFPNIHADKKGEWKLPAFRGIRQPILNVLVDVFDETVTSRSCQSAVDPMMVVLDSVRCGRRGYARS